MSDFLSPFSSCKYRKRDRTVTLSFIRWQRLYLKFTLFLNFLYYNKCSKILNPLFFSLVLILNTDSSPTLIIQQILKLVNHKYLLTIYHRIKPYTLIVQRPKKCFQLYYIIYFLNLSDFTIPELNFFLLLQKTLSNYSKHT